MNLPTVLILFLLGVWFALALRYLFRVRKHGGCASCGGCSACIRTADPLPAEKRTSCCGNCASCAGCRRPPQKEKTI